MYQDANGKAAIVTKTSCIIDDAGQGEPGFRWITTGGIRLYSCYWSPKTTIQEYEQFLYRLERSVRETKTEAIIAGDFNAWHTSWGSRCNNKRGEALADLITSLGLIICNRGAKPTFQRDDQESIIDITLATPGLYKRIRDWEVCYIASLSDHNYIFFTLQAPTSTPLIQNHRIRINCRKLEDALDSRALLTAESLNAEESASSLASKILETCRVDQGQVNSKRKSMHWWSQDLNDLRREANHKRRIYHRKKSRTGPDACATERENMKTAKLNLVKAIKRAKEASWKTLCDQVERDP